MRLNADIDPAVRSAQVFLDGVKVAYCIVADEERGYVVRYRTVNGKLVASHKFASGHYIVAKERVYGKVEIKLASASCAK